MLLRRKDCLQDILERGQKLSDLEPIERNISFGQGDMLSLVLTTPKNNDVLWKERVQINSRQMWWLQGKPHAPII